MLCKVCWMDAGAKCPYCKTTQRLASDEALSDSESSSSSLEDEDGEENVLLMDSLNDASDEEHVVLGGLLGNSDKYENIDEAWADTSDEEMEMLKRRFSKNIL